MFVAKEPWTLIFTVRKHAKPFHYSKMQYKNPQACTRPCFRECKRPQSDSLEAPVVPA